MRWLSGDVSRRVVLVFTAVVCVSRFGLAQLTSSISAARSNVFSTWQYGTVYAVLFLMLFLTLSRHRITMFGFVTSVFGVGVYAVQIYDIWPVLPSIGFYALMGLVLLDEAVTIWGLLHVHR